MIADGVKVQMCVTSPPYWGLRDYGTATWEGGEEACDHLPKNTHQRQGQSGDRANRAFTGFSPYRTECAKCNARRVDAQIGLEATIEEYVANMVEVFRLLREVLADDGTLWLNLGDSYAANGGHTAQGASSKVSDAPRNFAQQRVPPGLKPKDLCGMPWRVAFALQADGWYLRSDIIWHKPNPMPESCTDRPTKAHEYVFLLSKRSSYFYDAEAVREPATYGSHPRTIFDNVPPSPPGQPEHRGLRHYSGGPETGRNRRTVWTIPSFPFKDAHFATFPPKLVERCILAGSQSGDVVLDPFLGSGTVAEVAQQLGRSWIGIDLNPSYTPMQQRRTAQMAFALAAFA